MRAPVIIHARQNRLPRAPLRGACPASLTRPGPPWPRTSCLSTTEKERTMITLYDHIQELRAELRGCMTRRERAAVQAELAAATAAQAERDRAAETLRSNAGR